MKDIPLKRVQEAVKALLDIDDVSGIVELCVDQESVTAIVWSVDDNGNRFVRDDEVARDVVTRRIVR